MFYKDAAGSIFHTYSAYARGAEPLIGTYELLDMTPKGRDEEQLPSRWPGFAITTGIPKLKVHPAEGCCHSTERR